MDQQQALEALQALFPDRTELAVEWDNKTGHKPSQRFYLWDGPSIIKSSDRSWGHALALVQIEIEHPTSSTDTLLVRAERLESL